MGGFGSNHYGVVNSCLADGSIRYLSADTEAWTSCSGWEIVLTVRFFAHFSDAGDGPWYSGVSLRPRPARGLLI